VGAFIAVFALVFRVAELVGRAMDVALALE
jgi:hypothetical protein